MSEIEKNLRNENGDFELKLAETHINKEFTIETNLRMHEEEKIL